MTLIVVVIPELNSGQALTKVRIYCFLTITPIPDQVRNDGMAVTLTKIRTRNRHSDESQNLTDSESSSE
jgi:hypothetical protein